MYILGLGGLLHDYNCALIDAKGRRVTMYEAERASRRKHHVVPSAKEVADPIRKCCDDFGISPRHIDVVVFAHTDDFPLKAWVRDFLGDKKTYVDLDHHMAHAAGAYFASGFDSGAVVSMDGFGDGSSGIIAHGRGNKLEIIERISDENSIGVEYTRATYHLGLGGYGAEGKTRGLAPYGEPTVFEDYMNEIQVTPEGNLRLSERLRGEGSRLAAEGGYLNTQLLNNAFLNAYGPRRINPEPITDAHHNLAASIQKVLETVVGEQCRIAAKRTGEDHLLLSGGCVMNSSLNGELLRGGGFKKIFPLPMASDRGTGLGAALHYLHAVLDEPRFYTMDTVYYGQAFDDKAAAKAMKKGGLKAEKVDDVVGVAAEALSKGSIIGWFQGRSEMGARALGNRSIMADPRKSEMKDIINARVKHREYFRPFAPACMTDRAAEYFDFPEGVADLGYMTFTVASKQKAVDEAPAVVHVDGTARLQTVEEGRNGLYAQVIRRFGEITGTPIVLNTSFNDNGEPIVETPENAVRSFLNADMDLLCIGNVVGRKP